MKPICCVLLLVVVSVCCPGSYGSHPRLDDSDVTFYLFTPDNPAEPSVLRTGDDASLGSFDADLETIVAIHGQNGKGRGLDAIAKAYLSIGEYNAIELDWSGPSTGSYNDVKGNVYPVGALGAKLLDYLATKGLNLTKVHIQGVSLGGQVAGIIGGNVTAGKIGRISGLDPARSYFDTVGTDERLDKSDADFLEVIHSCSYTVGWLGPLGHADFYPNNGSCDQPGCDPSDHKCSHVRALYYFEESITSHVGFKSVQCDSWASYIAGSCDGNATVLMGEPTPTSTRGVYYLRTASSSPYALG